MSIHLTEDQLMDRLYGIAEADAHLDCCPDCQVRWAQIQLRREESAVAAPSPEFLRNQRRVIQDRMAAPRPSFNMIWVPATLAGMLIVGMMVTHTSSQPVPVPNPSSGVIEAGWFEDTYSATRIMEPRASSPIHELFVTGTGTDAKERSVRE